MSILISKSSDTVHIDLPIDQPLDLALTLQSGQAFRWHQVSSRWSGFIGGELVMLERVKDSLTIECNSTVADTIAAAVYQYFRLDDNLYAVYERFRADERLTHVIQQHWGLRILRQDPWECLIAFICSQNSNIARIAKTQESLANTLGNSVRMGGIERQEFPTAEALAATGE